MLYLWFKAFHVVAIIAWMAALLYLPRLMVYHVDAPKGSAQSETFKVMERRLLRAIATPSMIVAWVLGLTLAFQGNWFASPWLHGKLAFVVALSVMHMMMARWVRGFRDDANVHTAKFYRIWNEVPAVLMVVIVVLVIVKPF